MILRGLAVKSANSRIRFYNNPSIANTIQLGTFINTSAEIANPYSIGIQKSRDATLYRSDTNDNKYYITESGLITTTQTIINKSDRQAKHPLTNRKINSIINTEPLRRNQNDFMMFSLANAQLFIWESVTESTKLTYQTAWRHYNDFIIIYETDIRMKIIPKSWLAETNQFNIYWSFKESVILSYLNYLRTEGSQITPKSCNIYLAGVRFILDNIGEDSSFIANSMAIKRMKSRLGNLYRKERGNLECENGCKPLFWAAIIAFGAFVNLHPTKLNIMKAKS